MDNYDFISTLCRYGKGITGEIILVDVYGHVNTNENEFKINFYKRIEMIKDIYKNKAMIIIDDINIDITNKTQSKIIYINDIPINYGI